jgi:putative PIN family toxin of toxin-antitoxin system
VRIVLDTNVVVSGVFFGGIPGRILSAWHAGRMALVISAPILAEYREVGAELTDRHGGSAFERFAALLVLNSEVVEAPEYFNEGVCADPDDDKFLACALSAHVRVIVSGDPHLLAVSGWSGIEVIKPRAFVERYLADFTENDR